MNTHILDTEQPTTCPICGARTQFEELSSQIQQHQCLDESCNYKFIGEFEIDQES